MVLHVVLDEPRSNWVPDGVDLRFEPSSFGSGACFDFGERVLQRPGEKPPGFGRCAGALPGYDGQPAAGGRDQDVEKWRKFLHRMVGCKACKPGWRMARPVALRQPAPVFYKGVQKLPAAAQGPASDLNAACQSLR